MLSTLASNAILSKARAMYGRRLTDQDYKDLLACQTVAEVAAYLKNHTTYKQVLAGVNENSVHRGQLEAKLKQKLFEDFASLCRYELSVGEYFSGYLIVRSEIEQILHSIVLLFAGKPEEYLFTMPAYLRDHTRIDLNVLSQLKTFDDLLAALDHTPYREVLEPFRPVKGVPVNYTAIENALYSYLFSSVFGVIKKYTKGDTARQLRELFQSDIDLVNYSRIVRLKISYHEDPDSIKSFLLPFGGLDSRMIDRMAEAKTEEEVNAVMRKTSIGKRYLGTEHTYVDEIPKRVMYRICRKNMYYSTHPSVVMMSYTFLAQSELTDIITIVEGVRYKLPPDEIAKLLIVTNFKRKE